MGGLPFEPQSPEQVIMRLLGTGYRNLPILFLSVGTLLIGGGLLGAVSVRLAGGSMVDNGLLIMMFLGMAILGFAGYFVAHPYEVKVEGTVINATYLPARVVKLAISEITQIHSGRNRVGIRVTDGRSLVLVPKGIGMNSVELVWTRE